MTSDDRVNSKSCKRPVLHLYRSRESGVFDKAESLWEPELEEMFRYLENHRETIKEVPEKDASKKRSNVLCSIAIFGSHGSGKSSLLKTFVDRVESGKEIPRVCTLPVIEPNLVAKDEHFLYTFLATVWQKLEKHRDPDQRGDR